mgnify:CR=1 FL=1
MREPSDPPTSGIPHPYNLVHHSLWWKPIRRDSSA